MARLLASIGVLQLLVMLVGLARSKALSVLLGPAGFGIVSTVDSTVLTLVGLGALSLPFTALKFMARSHSEGSEPFERTYAAFLRVLGGLALLTTVVGIVLVIWTPGIFGRDLAGMQLPMVIAILGVPALMLNIFFVHTIAAAERAATSALLNLVTATALAAGALIGVLTHGVVGLYVASVTAGVAVMVGTLFFLRRRFGLHATHAAGNVLAELKRSPEIVSFSALIYLATSSAALAMLGARYFVIASAGAFVAGLLQALLSLALTVGAVMNPIVGLVLTPLVNRRAEPSAKIAATNRFAVQLLALLLLAALPVVLFPRLALTLLFSSAFAVGAGGLWLFVLWQCLYQLVNIYVQLLIGLDDVAVACGTIVGAQASAAMMFAPLISGYGLTGVALALVIAMLLQILAVAVRLRVKFGAGIAPRILLCGGYSVSVIAAAGLAFRARGATEFTPSGLGLRAAVALAAAACLWLLLADDERQQLLDRFRRRGRVAG